MKGRAINLYLAGTLLCAGVATGANVFNVSDYPSPQDAINAAEVAGGLVRFPCGVTTLNTGLVVDAPGVTLGGCGLGGTTLEATFSTGDIISLGNPSAAYPFCGSVRDMAIKSVVTRTSGYSISVAGCEKGTIENIHIENPSGGHGIHFGNTSGAHAHLVRVNNVTIENRGGGHLPAYESTAVSRAISPISTCEDRRTPIRQRQQAAAES